MTAGGIALEVLAILTFATVFFWYARRKYLSSSLAEQDVESKREYVVRAGQALQAAGYRIVDERIGHEVATFLGSRKFTTYAIADYLVEKGGVRYPVKVRSPRDPERISGAWLRSHLWGLWALYEVPVAYVHPDTGAIDLVDFTVEYPSSHYRRRWGGRVIWLLIGVALGWLLCASR